MIVNNKFCEDRFCAALQANCNLALEVAAAEGIRVNCVRPGLIYTDMHTDGGEPERVERLQTVTPLQICGQPEEVAEAIYWLASDKSSFSTGNFLDITGGL